MTDQNLLGDRRAVTPALSHVLTISITALLLVGLMMAAGNSLDSQREHTARTQLETIGNRLASELARVDTLGQYGGQASIRTRHPAQIAGGGYDVALEHRSECGISSANASCLVLESDEYSIVERVPVRNETNVSLTSVTSGTFRISGTAQSSATTGGRDREALSARNDLSQYVGIGADVGEDPLDTRRIQRNKAPIPSFDVRPRPPTTGREVTLDASDSHDRDGNITEYKWDVGNDGTWDASGEEVTYRFDTPGTRQVKLQVVDDHRTPASASLTENVTVSGLEYQNDLSGGIGSAEFTLYNNWSQPVRLSEVFVELNDDGVDRLEDGDEVEIDVDDDGDTDRSVDYDSEFTDHSCGSDDGVEISDSGVRLDVDQKTGRCGTTNGGVPVVDPGDTVEIRIDGFRRSDGTLASMGDKQMRVVIPYLVDDQPVETSFQNGVGIADVRLEQSGSNVKLRINSTVELDEMTVQLSGIMSRTLDRSDFTHNTFGSTHSHVTILSPDTSGILEAKLTDAEGVYGNDAVGLPASDSILIAAGRDYAWASESDWDENPSERGVVHEGFGDHASDVVELGYPSYDRGGDELVAYWPMDGDSANGLPDASGSGNGGTTTNVDGGSVGMFGTSSYYFPNDGGGGGFFGGNDADSYAEVTSTSELQGGDDATLTVSAWFLASDSVGESHGAAIVGKGGYDINTDWGLFVRDYCWDVETYCNDAPAVGYYGADDAGRPTEGYQAMYGGEWRDPTWHHVAFVLDEPNETMRLYYDGELKWEDDDIPDHATTGTNNPIEIGATTHSDSGFRGSIDEVRVYDRSLSTAEVERLNETGRRGEFTTATRTGSEIDASDLQLSYDVERDANDAVEVVVVDGDGDRSHPVSLGDGTGTVDVSGLSGASDEYRLEVELRSGAETKSPEIRALTLSEAP